MKRHEDRTVWCYLLMLLAAGSSPAAAQTWQQLSPSAATLAGRAIAPSVFDSTQNQLIVFGGFEAGGLATDLWRLSLGPSPAWSQIAVGNPTAVPQYVGSAVYDAANSRMILFGGTNGSAQTNTTTVLSNANGVGGTSAWIPVSPPVGTALPSARIYHSAVYDPGSNRMIVFGGENSSEIPLSDLWVLTNANGLGGTPLWTPLQPIGEIPARYGHSAVYDSANNRMIVFGGNAVINTSEGPANDVWVLSNANGLGGTPTWTQLFPTGTAPAVRAWTGAIFDPVTDRMVLFGGVGSPTVYGDVWSLSHANGLGGAPAWTNPLPTGGPPSQPAARYGSSVGYNSSINQMVVFAGYNNGGVYYNDTWVVNDANSSAPTLNIAKTHTGSFFQGEQNATYTVTVSNAGTATSGMVTVTENLPAGLSLVSMTGGASWNCTGNTCTRSDSLAAGASYPSITVTVNVAANASTPQVNVVNVSGGGSSGATAIDSTAITAPPSLSITKTHTGNFTQAQTGATFTVTVSNAAGAGATNGTVTVTDTVPTGLTFGNMTGSGWTCNGAACTRSDPLASGASYPAITVTMNVSATAPGSATNFATVSLPGATTAAAQDTVTIVPIAGCTTLTFDTTVGSGPLTESCTLSNPNNLTLGFSAPSWLSGSISGGLVNITATPANLTGAQPGVPILGVITLVNNSSSVGTITVTITLTDTVTVSPGSNGTVAAGGLGSGSLTVTSSGAWAVVNNNASAGVTINSPSADSSGNYCGSGNSSVSYTVPANTTPNARIFTFTILSGCPSTGPTFAVATFTITQAGQGGCNANLVFPPGQQTSFFYSAAGTGANNTTVALTNSTCSPPTASQPWITITGTGASSLTFSVAAYTGSVQRTGSIQVNVQGTTGIITITQNPPVCTYSVATTSGFNSTFSAAGGQGSIDVHASAGCGWTATASNTSFIEGLSPGSLGVGSPANVTSVTFTIPANNTTSEKSGSITIAGTGQTLQYAVTELPPTINNIVPSYQCTVNPDPVRMLRAEGVAELTADIVLICSGQSVGGVMGDVVVTFNPNTSITNHTLSTDHTNSTTDALLLNVDQIPSTWTLNTNAYRGLVAGPRSIRFPSVSLAPETGAFLHTFRITNTRVDAARLANAVYGSSTAPLVRATVTIQPPLMSPTSGAPFQLLPSNAQTVGEIPYVSEVFSSTSHRYAQPSSEFGVGALTTGGPGGTSYWPLSFTEQQTNAYLPAVQSGQAPASTSGVQYIAESGFINLASFGPETGYSGNGRWGSTSAAMGTRLLVNIASVPCSVTLYAPVAPASGGEAQLVSADSTGAGGFAVVSSARIPPTSQAALPGYELISLVPDGGASSCTSTGSATVTWEVTSALVGSPSSLFFNLYVYNPGSVSLAGVTFNGIGSGSTNGAPATQNTVSAPNSTAPIPRFNTFANVSNTTLPASALSFFFEPAGSVSTGDSSFVPPGGTATLASAPVPLTTAGGQCSQSVTASGTNNGSTAASNVAATIEGSGPLSGCFGPTGSTSSVSGSSCTCNTNVPAGGSYTCTATSTSCTLQTYTGSVTSDGGNTDPNNSAGFDGQPPNLVITPDQLPAAFIQGDVSGDDTLTVQVENNGGDAPPGAVTVSGTLPDSRLTVVGVQAGSDPFSQYWQCAVNSPSTWSCSYNNFPLQNAAEVQTGFTKFIATFHTNAAACSNVSYTQQVSVSINGNQYLSGATQTIAVQGKLQITSPTSSTLPAATSGTPYSFTFAASGGCGTYAWSATGLPTGLSINPTTGAITGTPSGTGTASVTVTVSDPANTATTLQATYSLPLSSAGTNTTIVTVPAGLQFTVDGGAPQTAPQTLPLSQGTHSIALPSPQTGPAGAQNVFTSWNNGSTVNPRSITVGTSSATYTADFQTQYQLTISASPTAGGTVSPASGAYFASGTAVPITATPNAGYTFTGWTGSVASSSSAATTVTMNAAETVTANFSPITGITIVTVPAGLQFTVDGGAAQTAPQTLQLSQGNHSIALVSPQAGAVGTRYSFTGWSDSNTANPRTIPVGTSAATYTADFQTQYQLTISASPFAGGTVSPASGSYYASGTAVPIVATAGSGYTFGSWSGSVANAASASTTVTMSAPETVVANFSLPGITIQTSPPGLQFTVDGGAAQTAPQTLSLTQGNHSIALASPQPGTSGTRYTFNSWSDGNTANPRTITVGAASASYLANFQTQYQLTISASPAADGTVSPATGAFYNSGTAVPIAATANATYVFTSWTGSVANTASASTTVTMSGPETVTANFASTTGTTITIQTSPPGLQFTIDAGAAQTAPQTVSLTPGTHTIAVAVIQAGSTGTQYVFASWSDGGQASHNISVGTSPATYTVTFQTQYQLTISASPFAGGTVSPSSSTFYNSGANVLIGATASTGYQFLNWNGSVAAPNSASTTVAMTGPESVTANFITTTALAFYPVTPCRVVDTRGGTGTFGGPIMPGGSTRVFPIPLGPCSIPSTAQAFALNVTAVPQSTLGYLTVWPTGQNQPNVSTLNSYNGAVVANAAIVPAGTGGQVSVFVTDNTQVILDINGYFAPQGLAFYPLTPCRVADTRGAVGAFGGPSMHAGQTRNFPLPSSGCAIPASAQAYSLNMTAVPQGALQYLTTWPTGQAQPGVSTLNAYDGRIVANAAMVPAGSSGSISVYTSDATDVIIDINGYFAPAGGAGALNFYTAPPCRVADTRNAAGPFGGPEMTGGSTRSFTIPQGSCSIPTTAQSYSLNVTVVPNGALQYLTLWPAGGVQPIVSTLNAYNGGVVANAAIVPGGVAGGISVFVSDATQVILDINGYFAP